MRILQGMKYSAYQTSEKVTKCTQQVLHTNDITAFPSTLPWCLVLLRGSIVNLGNIRGEGSLGRRTCSCRKENKLHVAFGSGLYSNAIYTRRVLTLQCKPCMIRIE